MVKQLKVCTFIQLLSDKEKYKFKINNSIIKPKPKPISYDSTNQCCKIRQSKSVYYFI